YLRVSYGECDAQKVVFNARYADYIDITVMECMRSMGYEQDLVDGTIDYQLVKQTLEWKAPARFDQVLEVSMYTKHLGNTSFTLAADFRIAGEERVIVIVETVYVLVEQRSATMTRVVPNLSIVVVPDYGTGELKGTSGKMNIIIAHDGKHSYEFDYTIE